MTDAIEGVLLVAGASFMLLAAVGVVRMPDVFLRLQTSTKAATLGASLVLIAAAVRFAGVWTSARAVIVVVLISITLPVAAHMLARAAYFSRVSLWEGTEFDELQGKYDRETHDL